MSEPLALADAAKCLRGKPGRPPLSDEEKNRRAEERRQRRAAALASVSPRLFDVPAAARYLGVSVWTIRDLVSSGRLPRVVIPTTNGGDLRAIRIDRESLDHLINSWTERA